MPTPKDPEIEKILTGLVGISRQEAAQKGICPTCRGYVTGFKDHASVIEHQISGMCQKCQDNFFEQ